MKTRADNRSNTDGTRRWQLWLAGVLFLVTLLAGCIFSWLVLVGCNNSSLIGWSLSLITPFSFATVGLGIVRFRPDNRVGWLCLANGVFLALQIADPICLAQDFLPQSLRVWAARYIYNFAPTFILGGIFFLLPMIFPTGQFLSRRWRNLTLVLLFLSFAAALLHSFAPDFAVPNIMGMSIPLENPIGLRELPDWWQDFFSMASFVPLLLGVFASISAIVLRYRRAHGDERQQIKYFSYFFGLIVLIYLIFFDLIGSVVLKPRLVGTTWEQVFDIAYDLSVVIVFAGVPLSIGLAILKFRLYDIDILIRRTLVYGMLTLLLGALYFGSVVVLQQVLGAFTGQQDSPLAIVISTLAIAALFNPLRTRLQEIIDRRFYRQRYDAERALATFAAQVRDETDIQALAEMLSSTVAKTFQPENLTFWFTERHHRSTKTDTGFLNRTVN